MIAKFSAWAPFHDLIAAFLLLFLTVSITGFVETDKTIPNMFWTVWIALIVWLSRGAINISGISFPNNTGNNKE